MSEVDPYAKIAHALSGSMPSAPGLRFECYAALGDSFTAGTGSDPGQPWADRVAHYLRAQNPDLMYRNFAMEGARSDQVLAQVPLALQLEPDLVTVVCGANDALLSVRPDPLAYARNLGSIFRQLRHALPGVLVLTATSPEEWPFLGLRPRSAARFSRSIARLNQVTRSVATSYDVPCLEVVGAPGVTDAENFCSDGLHPSPRGHARTAAAFAGLLASRAGDDQQEED